MTPQHPIATPFDAWCLARLLAGLTLDQPLARVSEPFRTIVQKLVDVPSEDRAQVWEEHRASLPEDVANDLVTAIVAINPADPAPEDDGWEMPQLEKPVPVDPFPVDIYPEPVERLIRQGATAIGCPPDFLGMAVLGVAGAAIGRSVSLRLKDSYFASPAFYIANVGKPGEGKSPAVSAVLSPMWLIDEDAHQKYKEAMTTYDRDCEAFKDAERAARRPARVSKPRRARSDDEDELDDDVEMLEDDATDGDELANTRVQPVRPVLSRAIVDDFTTESLAPLLSDNPRGLLVAKDELTGLMGSLNQYRSGRGADRQILLSVWSGSSIVVDRKGNADRIPIRVTHPFLGILGGLQPNLLSDLAESKGRDDGFLDRLLFTYPDPVPKQGWTDEGIPKETATTWTEMIKRLWQRPMSTIEGRLCPLVVKLTPDAKAIWRQWYNSHQAEQNADDFPDWLRGPWAKFEQYAARIALTLHMLHWASEPALLEVAIPDVGPESVRDAVRLVDYLKGHTRRVRSIMSVKEKGNDGGEQVQTILKWTCRLRLESFSERDLTRNFPKFAERAKDLHSALMWLVQRHCIRPRPEPQRPAGRKGRKPSPVYEVNPHLIAMLEVLTVKPRPNGAQPISESVNSVNSAIEEFQGAEKEELDGPPF